MKNERNSAKTSNPTDIPIAENLVQNNCFSAKRFLTVPEVAEYLRLGKSTIYRMLQEGRIPYVRSSIGKKSKYIIFKNDVEASMRVQKIINR